MVKDHVIKIDLCEKDFCKSCGAPKAEVFERSEFKAFTYPRKITYKDKRIETLHMSEVLCLFHLIKHGAISNTELANIFVGLDADIEAIRVRIWRIRKKLREIDEGLTNAIATVRGFGYELAV